MRAKLASPPALARMPLFDRLAEASAPARAGGNPAQRMLDRTGLEASVARELLRMLNRRVAPSGTAALTVLDYGLPDWSGLFAANPDDRLRIARSLVRAVRAFEPRLLEPHALVEPSARGAQALTVRLAARLAAGQQSWPVQFDLAFGPFGVVLALAGAD